MVKREAGLSHVTWAGSIIWEISQPTLRTDPSIKKLFLPNLYWDLWRSWSSAAFVQIFLSNLSARRFDCAYINEVFRMKCCKWSIWQFLTCHLVWHVSALKPNIAPVCFCHPFFIDVKDMQARRSYSIFGYEGPPVYPIILTSVFSTTSINNSYRVLTLGRPVDRGVKTMAYHVFLILLLYLPRVAKALESRLAVSYNAWSQCWSPRNTSRNYVLSYYPRLVLNTVKDMRERTMKRLLKT